MAMVEIQEISPLDKSDSLPSDSLLDFPSEVSPGLTDHPPTEEQQQEDSHSDQGGSPVQPFQTPGQPFQGALVQDKVQDASDAWKPEDTMHPSSTQ